MPLKRPLDHSSLGDEDKRRPGYLDIHLGRERRWKGLLGYVVLFVSVAGVLVLLFHRFTSSLWLAIGLVGFLVTYMLLMGWWASRNIEGHDQ